MTDLTTIANQHPEYARLTTKYSDADVRTYLTAVDACEQTRAVTFELLARTTGEGLSVNFHERVEMEQLETLVDARYGSGYFAARLHDGTIQGSDVFSQGFIAAHWEASKQEVAFVIHLAIALGYDTKTTREALIATKPTWMNTIDANQSLLQHYLEIQRINLDDHIPPLSLSSKGVLEAFRFWEQTGATYTQEARAVLVRYIGAELVAGPFMDELMVRAGQDVAQRTRLDDRNEKIIRYRMPPDAVTDVVAYPTLARYGDGIIVTTLFALDREQAAEYCHAPEDAAFVGIQHKAGYRLRFDGNHERTDFASYGVITADGIPTENDLKRFFHPDGPTYKVDGPLYRIDPVRALGGGE